MKQVDPRNLGRWRIDLAGACACLVLTLAAYFLGFGPLARTHAGLIAKQRQLAAQSCHHGRLERAAAAMRSRLVKIEQALVESELQLEPADRVNQRIARATKLAVASGLKVDAVRLGKGRRQRRFAAFPITLAGVGTYRQCQAFLHRLSRGSADTAVTDFDLSANPANPAAAKFRFELLWHAAPSAGEAQE